MSEHESGDQPAETTPETDEPGTAGTSPEENASTEESGTSTSSDTEPASSAVDEPADEELQTDAEQGVGVAPTQSGDGETPFRPSSDFEDAAEEE